MVIPVAEIGPGDLLLVRPGEKLAGDGIVAAGASALDQSPITGESVPVDKSPGDPVHAGSLNGHGALEVTVTLGSPQAEVRRDLLDDLGSWKIFASLHSLHFTDDPVFSFLRKMPL
jgi:magnesium-transporting ATPase (P-type)